MPRDGGEINKLLYKLASKELWMAGFHLRGDTEVCRTSCRSCYLPRIIF